MGQCLFRLLPQQEFDAPGTAATCRGLVTGKYLRGRRIVVSSAVMTTTLIAIWMLFNALFVVVLMPVED
jgi:hypothetical protein